MALEGFYNLKDKKKENILQSVVNCLKEKTYDELSVNDIVVAADISRGSFYNYFVDKSDAVSTLVDSKIKQYMDGFVSAVIFSSYDLIEGTRHFYEQVKERFKDEINISIVRNIRFLSEFAFQSLHSEKFRDYRNEIIDWLIKNTKEGKEVLKTKKKMQNILDMLVLLVLNSIVIQIIFRSNFLSANDDLNYKLDTIKKGLI